jgi:hypothetical protein
LHRWPILVPSFHKLSVCGGFLGIEIERIEIWLRLALVVNQVVQVWFRFRVDQGVLNLLHSLELEQVLVFLDLVVLMPFVCLWGGLFLLLDFLCWLLKVLRLFFLGFSWRFGNLRIRSFFFVVVPLFFAFARGFLQERLGLLVLDALDPGQLLLEVLIGYLLDFLVVHELQILRIYPVSDILLRRLVLVLVLYFDGVFAAWAHLEAPRVSVALRRDLVLILRFENLEWHHRLVFRIRQASRRDRWRAARSVAGSLAALLVLVSLSCLLVFFFVKLDLLGGVREGLDLLTQVHAFKFGW